MANEGVQCIETCSSIEARTCGIAEIRSFFLKEKTVSMLVQKDQCEERSMVYTVDYDIINFIIFSLVYTQTFSFSEYHANVNFKNKERVLAYTTTPRTNDL